MGTPDQRTWYISGPGTLQSQPFRQSQRTALVEFHFIDGRVPVEGSLSSPIICMVEARQQDLKIRLSRDIEAENLAYDTTVEALDHTVGLRGIGLCFAVRDLEFGAGALEIVSGEA